MADIQTIACFRLGCSDEEAAILRELDGYERGRQPAEPPSQAFLRAFPQRGSQPLSGFHDILKRAEIACSPSFANQLYVPYGDWFHKSQDMNLGYVEAALFYACPSAFPIRFSWANISDRAYADCCGGGVTIIDETGVGGWSSFDLLHRWEKQATMAKDTFWRVWQDEDRDWL